MNKFQWVAYGLDMFGYVIIETEGIEAKDSHQSAVELFKQQGVDFDTVEPFDESFVNRMQWLNK